MISIDRIPERLEMAECHVGSEVIDYTATDVGAELLGRSSLRLASVQVGTRPTMTTTPHLRRMRQSRVLRLLDCLEREPRADPNLAYRQASGANHAEEVPHVVTEGWHRIGTVDEFPAGQPVRRSVDDVPVLVAREPGGTIHALAERCGHLAGPLSEGTVADGCVECLWHGSVFRLSDGWNVRGPATAPQPAFDSRIVDGRVEVRLRRQDRGDRPGNGRGADRHRSATETGTAHGHSS